MKYVVRGGLIHGYISDATTKPPTGEIAEWRNGETLDDSDPRTNGIDFAGLQQDGVLQLPGEANPLAAALETQALVERNQSLEAQLAALQATLATANAEAKSADATFPAASESSEASI